MTLPKSHSLEEELFHVKTSVRAGADSTLPSSFDELASQTCSLVHGDHKYLQRFAPSLLVPLLSQQHLFPFMLSLPLSP